LEFGGHEVTSAQDGLEAIAKIDGPGRFDALVTDYAMPRVCGIDVIVHARQVDPMLACIIVTAYRDLDLAMRAMQAGAVAYLPKPFRAEHMLTVLNGALERRELAAEALRLRVLAPMLERFTMVLANTIESKDVATQRHANRLVHLAHDMAGHLGIDNETASAIRYGACLHDIGKVAVPQELLTRPGALTEEEMEVMRLHPVLGARILSDIDTWDDVRLIVRHHHERFDGRGYPDGLRGEQIPMGARLVAVVDSFDVMRSGRPYAASKSQDQILSELHRERSRQFDPEMVDALLAVITESDFTLSADQDDGAYEPSLMTPGRAHSMAEGAIAGWLVSEPQEQPIRVQA
jgi:putative two-component system response regulator